MIFSPLYPVLYYILYSPYWHLVTNSLSWFLVIHVVAFVADAWFVRE